jgi:hypothetical protein
MKHGEKKKKKKKKESNVGWDCSTSRQLRALDCFYLTYSSSYSASLNLKHATHAHTPCTTTHLSLTYSSSHDSALTLSAITLSHGNYHTWSAWSLPVAGFVDKSEDTEVGHKIGVTGSSNLPLLSACFVSTHSPCLGSYVYHSIAYTARCTLFSIYVITIVTIMSVLSQGRVASGFPFPFSPFLLHPPAASLPYTLLWNLLPFRLSPSPPSLYQLWLRPDLAQPADPDPGLSLCQRECRWVCPGRACSGAIPGWEGAGTG